MSHVHLTDHMILAGDYRIHAKMINYIKVFPDKDWLHVYMNNGDTIKFDRLSEIFSFVRQYKYFLQRNGIAGGGLIQPVPNDI